LEQVVAVARDLKRLLKLVTLAQDFSASRDAPACRIAHFQPQLSALQFGRHGCGATQTENCR